MPERSTTAHGYLRDAYIRNGVMDFAELRRDVEKAYRVIGAHEGS